MSTSIASSIFDALPAGEWADVRLLKRQPGMMAHRNWAVFATGRWLRGGGRSAFIKLIIPAGVGAGYQTKMVTGETRLKALAARLLHIKDSADKIPIVPIFEVSQTEAGLLIAMEAVRPLKDLIDHGQAYDYSLRLLAELDPLGNDWMHFDICPLNIGITSTGKCVLIDVESMYVAEGDEFKVSVPAWKTFRAPKSLKDAVQQKLAIGFDLDRDFALRKVRFEVGLAAAECMAGPMELRSTLGLPPVSWTP